MTELDNIVFQIIMANNTKINFIAAHCLPMKAPIQDSNELLTTTVNEVLS